MLQKTVLLLCASLFFAQAAWSATYKIDPAHSQVGFAVKHLVWFTVRGEFSKFSGEIEADPASKTLQSVKGVIQMGSINTRQEKRDKHLKSSDFFDVNNYPEMSFVSTKITGSGQNIQVIGDLSIRGITRPLTLTGAFLGEMKNPRGGRRLGLIAKATLNRNDFKVSWNKALETGGVVVGPNVEITLEIQAVSK